LPFRASQFAAENIDEPPRILRFFSAISDSVIFIAFFAIFASIFFGHFLMPSADAFTIIFTLLHVSQQRCASCAAFSPDYATLMMAAFRRDALFEAERFLPDIDGHAFAERRRYRR
jgi:hypothetical protein